MARETEGMSHIEREKALYRYTNALERGDFEAVSSVLALAAEDSDLERMVLQVNQVYEAEMVEQRAPVTAAVPRRRGLVERLLHREKHGERGGKKTGQVSLGSSGLPLRGRPGLWVALAAGGIVLSIALTFLVRSAIYSPTGAANQSTDFVPVVGLPGTRGMVPAAQPTVAPAAHDEAAASGGDAWFSYAASDTAESVDRLIIRSGNLSLVVADTRAARRSIEAMVADMAAEGAFIVSSQETASGDAASPAIQMTLRVPAARFQEAMDRIASLAERVVDRNESAQDVTEEYVDLDARLQAMDTARQRLLEIMGSAGTTKDLLAAEAQLTQREADMESLKGRQQYLAQSAQLASIQVGLQASILSQPVGNHWRPAETVRKAVDSLVGALRGLGDGLIFFAIAVLPWLLLAALVVYLIVRLALWRLRAHT
jgi:hypothetical protein